MTSTAARLKVSIGRALIAGLSRRTPSQSWATLSPTNPRVEYVAPFPAELAPREADHALDGFLGRSETARLERGLVQREDAGRDVADGHAEARGGGGGRFEPQSVGVGGAVDVHLLHDDRGGGGFLRAQCREGGEQRDGEGEGSSFLHG